MERRKQSASVTRLMFSTEPELAKRLLRADQLGAINAAFQQELPESLRGRVTLMNIEDSTAVLGVSSGALATSLRMRTAEIAVALDRCTDSGMLITSYRVQVIPPEAPPPSDRKPPALSEDNAQILLEEANQTEDAGLRQALERLASHGRVRKPQEPA